MSRARILLIRPRTTRVFRIFVTSTYLINREFLAFPSVIFFKKWPHFLQEAEVNTRGFNYSETSIKRMPSIKRTLIKPGPEINVLSLPFITNPYSADTSVKRTRTLQ